MTSNTMFTRSIAARPRRATFVPSPADTATHRAFVAVTAAAVVVSAASIGILAPLFL